MNYTSVKNVTPMLDSVNLPIALNKEIETGRRERKKGIEREFAVTTFNKHKF